MNNWDLIIKEFPLLYKYGMTFECGMGWYNIIYKLSLAIERILEDFEDVNPKVEGENCDFINIYATQVKEKYGTLRFYLSYETEEIEEIIEEAIAESSQTCEICGNFGKMRGEKWLIVRCDKCYEAI